MNSTIRIALAGAACVLGSVGMLAQNAGSPPTPPVDGQIASAPPAEGYVWMSGHWNSEGGQWKFQPAHWELPPSRSATWVGGHWVPSGGSWVWANGAWNISDAAQAQSGPPLPPGQGAQSAGVPSPSTPAPYVDGQYQAQYGPGGVVRAIDQPPTTVDYGPIDYDAGYASYPGYYAYPGYYWGDPWFWGFPAVALGFGFGHGFHGGFAHGFARGGFAHGGFGGHAGR